MSLNQTKLIEQYTSGNEEARADSSRTAGLEFYYTKKHLGGMIGKNDRVLEIGCATGYYGLYYAEQCREYVGIDIVPKHIGLFREKIAARGLKNVSCQVGDGTDLKGIEDESFDVVLCLGPMYHLTEQERSAFLKNARGYADAAGRRRLPISTGSAFMRAAAFWTAVIRMNRRTDACWRTGQTICARSCSFIRLRKKWKGVQPPMG